MDDDLLAVSRWIIRAVGIWAVLIGVVVLYRHAWYFYESGWRNYLHDMFRIEPETWWLIAVLILVALACAMAFVAPNFMPLF